MKIKKYNSLVLFLLILPLCFSCNNGKKKKSGRRYKQEISINIEHDPMTLHPGKARILSDYNLIRTFNEGLYRINKDGITSPALAEKCSISDDKKTYTIQIKESLWSNGHPVTAHDFVYAWKTLLNKTFPAPNASLLYPIKNARAIKEGLLPMSMLGIQTEGDHTIIIELQQEIPYFTELLSLPVYFPLCENVDKKSKTWTTNADEYVCNGPFKIESWQHRNEIIAVKNNTYWDAKEVKLDKIKMCMVSQDTGFNMYQNKELNWAGSPYSQIPTDAISNLENTKILKKDPLLGTFWIKSNISSHPLHDKNFRKALSTAINRKDLVTHVMLGGGDVATSIVPAAMGIQASPLIEDGNIGRALAYLKQACDDMHVSKKNIPQIMLTYVGSGTNHKIAAAIQEQWRKSLGISIRLEPLESKVYIDKINSGDYQLACGSWIADFNDAINFLEIFKSKHLATNGTKWESLDYMKALDSTYVCNDEKERTSKLSMIEKMIMEDSPVIPIYHYNMLHLQDDNLKDVILSKTGHIDFKWAHLTE